jgi:hypothetical protein
MSKVRFDRLTTGLRAIRELEEFGELPWSPWFIVSNEGRSNLVDLETGAITLFGAEMCNGYDVTESGHALVDETDWRQLLFGD